MKINYHILWIVSIIINLTVLAYSGIIQHKRAERCEAELKIHVETLDKIKEMLNEANAKWTKTKH